MVLVALSRKANKNLIFYFSLKYYFNVGMLKKKIVLLKFSSILDDSRRSEKE